ncbi:MAG TPA: glycosyltransferase family 4 protein [Roseiflexaceae bacterium]|nr:glycosyltransferase family 4 protein [Roseiflexaceae bacterium]
MIRTTPRHVLILGLGAVTRDFARNWPEPVLARALARRGHRVSAVGYYEPGHPAMAARRETIDSIESLRLDPSIWPSAQLGRALDALPRPDVMHIFHFRNVFVYNAVAWARKRGVPIVHSPVGPLHDAYLVEDRERPYTSHVHFDRLAYSLPGLARQLVRDPRPRRQFTNYLLHAPLRYVDRFVASSHHELGLLERMGFARERCEVIPLWIEDAPPLVPDESVLKGVERPIVLFIKQLTPRSGYDVLVESIPTVAARHPTATFVVVSHNPARQAEMRARAEQLGVSGNLHFAGRVSEEQKLALLRAASCIALPSRYEGFGLPLLEAMQAGLPPIASDIPVIDEIVSDGEDGLLFERENPAALAGAILRLLDDAALRARLIAGGRAKLARDFDEDRLVERLLACYAKAIG